MVREIGMRPNTEERLRMVMEAGKTKCILNASFVPWFEKVVVGFVDKFTIITKMTDDLARWLRLAHPASAPPAAFTGLSGDDLFFTLMTLRFPSVTLKCVHLEVTLFAQCLTQQDMIYRATHAYEQIIYEDNYVVRSDARMMAFACHTLALDNIV